MSNGDPEREQQENQLQSASSTLDVIDRMINGDRDAILSVDDLGMLRALLLDKIEVAEAALGLNPSQGADSIQRTISLGLNAGILAALEAREESAQHLPVVESPNRPGVRWMLHMPCPECGEPGVEQTGPDPDDDGDEAAVTVHPDRDEYDSPIGTRGGYTQIDLWCPNGHSFALIIANHKGDEYIGVTATKSAAQEG